MMFGQVAAGKGVCGTRPVDFRKGCDALSLAVQEMVALDPFMRGGLFVFRSKNARTGSNC